MFSLEHSRSLIRTMGSACSKLIEICRKHQREEFIPFLEGFLNYPTEGEISTETVVDFSIRLSSFRHIMLAIASESKTMLRPDISLLVLMATLEGENDVLEQKMFKAVEFSKEFFECLRISLLSVFGEKEDPLQELFSNISEN